MVYLVHVHLGQMLEKALELGVFQLNQLLVEVDQDGQHGVEVKSQTLRAGEIRIPQTQHAVHRQLFGQ